MTGSPFEITCSTTKLAGSSTTSTSKPRRRGRQAAGQLADGLVLRLAVVGAASVLSQEVAIDQLRSDLAQTRAEPQ